MSHPATLTRPTETLTTSTAALLGRVKSADQDFEWYPTTDRMIEKVAKHIDRRTASIMDIGAGDGRVLERLAGLCEDTPDLYAIEKSDVLVQAQPRHVVPVGTDFYEQNLACLPVDTIFCNPPYSDFETWAAAVIESGHARTGFLVIPQRWKQSDKINAAVKRRGAIVRVIHSDDFHDAERRARATVDIVKIDYPTKSGYGYDEAVDPFDIWFDNHIDTSYRC
ncbi:MAG: class I SAM-dependent methyltransferase, partial [Planctomycetota bacterium]